MALPVCLQQARETTFNFLALLSHVILVASRLALLEGQVLESPP